MAEKNGFLRTLYVTLGITVILGGGFAWLLKTSWVSAETESKMREIEPKVELQEVLMAEQRVEFRFVRQDINEIKENINVIAAKL